VFGLVKELAELSLEFVYVIGFRHVLPEGLARLFTGPPRIEALANELGELVFHIKSLLLD
jgi:hypothetical protein